MKKLFTIIGLAMALAVNAQTNTNPPVITGPISKVIDFLAFPSTNWYVAPYGIYDTGSKAMGAGLGLAYKLSDFVIPTLRLDYLDGDLFMPSANLQLQAPVTLMGKFTMIPFVFGGVAVPLSGRGDENRDAIGMFGAGMAIQITRHWDLIGDYEIWSGFKGEQYRFGVVYKF